MLMSCQHALADCCCSIIVYCTVADDGSVVDGKRTVVHGAWTRHVQQALQAGGITCNIADSQSFQQQMIIKLLWSTLFWMMCAALGNVTVGTVATRTSNELAALVDELLPLALRYVNDAAAADSLPSHLDFVSANQPQDTAKSIQQSVSVPHAAACEALIDYSVAIGSAIPSTDMAYKEFRWRNGWFLSQQATPLHCAWLRQAGCPPEYLEQHTITPHP
eukprot:jgi/Chrzof1/538/Cz01g19140.t1